jgi:hypothetical protein
MFAFDLHMNITHVTQQELLKDQAVTKLIKMDETNILPD